MAKRYDQFCPIAHALSLVGERWSLLVVRELLKGPRRYTDLAGGLPGIGTNILALAQSPMMDGDAPVPTGAASLQLAFRVAPPDVSRCEAELRAAGIAITSPATDQPWAHRTLFFRDPDGNVLEIYADI